MNLFPLNNATTFAWDVPALTVHPSLDGLANVVIHVDYTLTATRPDVDETGNAVMDANGNAIIYTAGPIPIPLKMGEPNPNAFADYGSLTLDTAVSWLSAARSPGAINGMMYHLDELIDAQIAANAVAILPPPWS